MRTLIVSMLALTLAACTSSHVLVGTKRAPIDPAQVQVYLDPPANFERVALLEANSNASFTFTKQGRTDKVIERLKAEAAQLGANGILLQGIGTEYAGSVGTMSGSAYSGGYSGIGYSAPVTTTAGSAVAIYVSP